METVYGFFNRTGILFEIAALLAAIYQFRKYRSTAMVVALPFLCYLVGIEVYSKYFHDHRSVGLYNPVIMVEGLFYLLGFYYSFQLPHFKKLSLLFLVIYIIGCGVNLFLLNSYQQELVSHAYTLSSLMIIILYLLYMYEWVQSDMQIRFQEQLFFWIANGIFIFHILRILPEFMLNYKQNNLSIDQNTALKILKYLGSDILYSFYIIGFFKCKAQPSPSR